VLVEELDGVPTEPLACAPLVPAEALAWPPASLPCCIWPLVFPVAPVLAVAPVASAGLLLTSVDFGLGSATEAFGSFEPCEPIVVVDCPVVLWSVEVEADACPLAPWSLEVLVLFDDDAHAPSARANAIPTASRFMETPLKMKRGRHQMWGRRAGEARVLATRGEFG
jgi:hypothetical protein